MKKLRWLILPLFVIAFVAVVGPQKLVTLFRDVVETVRWADRVSNGSAPPPAAVIDQPSPPGERPAPAPEAPSAPDVPTRQENVTRVERTLSAHPEPAAPARE